MAKLVNSPSELNEVIEFSKLGYYEDELMNQIEEDVKLFSTWCKVMTQSLKDFSGEARGYITDKTVFIIRYDQPQPIDGNMKVHWNGDVYEITDILRDTAAKQYDKIVCKKLK